MSLTARLRKELGRATRPAIVASLDVLPPSDRTAAGPYADQVDAADMQTAALFTGAMPLRLAMAAVLIVVESAAGGRITDERLEASAKLAGAAAAAAL